MRPMGTLFTEMSCLEMLIVLFVMVGNPGSGGAEGSGREEPG